MLIKRISKFKDRPIDVIPFEKYRKMTEEKRAESQTSVENIRNTHTCNGSAKQEKSAENSLLRNVTTFDEKLYTSRKSVNLSRINTKKAMPRCSIVSLLKDKEKILKVARET